MKTIEYIQMICPLELVKMIKNLYNFDEHTQAIIDICKNYHEQKPDGYIEIKDYKNEFDGQTYTCASLIKNNDSYSTSFIPINEYLNMEVKAENQSNIVIAAVLFYDMTFFGYNESTILNEKNIIMDKVDKLEK